MNCENLRYITVLTPDEIKAGDKIVGDELKSGGETRRFIKNIRMEKDKEASAIWGNPMSRRFFCSGSNFISRE
ncbi:MAG: hypothetical protein K0Q94_2413 [Paenibacillus sp.]|jgi:hypothetical protein|nr:hypothetical protein [Paenibacillus sp.]